MGVPKFFRWLSERYPKINQRFGSPPNEETAERYFPADDAKKQPNLDALEPPDPLSTCGLAPEIDRIYIDMNGIIHGCSHNNITDSNSNNSNSNSGDVSGQEEPIDGANNSNIIRGGGKMHRISNDEIFRNVCYYLDRVIGDMIQPKQVVYMAIDGVAPRAKMNQQRSRRYRSGREGEIETNIYEAHANALEEEEELLRREEEEEDEELLRQQRQEEQQSYTFSLDYEEGNRHPSTSSHEEADGTLLNNSRDNDTTTHNSSSSTRHTTSDLREIAPGRFKGKFETHIDEAGGLDKEAFHSNAITPGTPFFTEFTKHLEHFVKYKLSTDPKWRDLTIIFSGPNVPGEGEHKIMQFIREQREKEDYDPNLRHCIMGQDGDLMMLGLATHEPNMVLLRERVIFNINQQRLEEAKVADALDTYLHNSHFEFLHMGVLRDYLAYEFETSNVISDSPWDLERTIDDFVFLTFLVGNDFLPHLPAIDIGDNAFDLLFWTYKNCRKKWRKRKVSDDPNWNLPYLTYQGNIVSGKRLEQYLAAVGSHEVAYYDKKSQSAKAENKRLRKQYKKLGMGSDMIPDKSLVASKEASDRAAYRKMLQKFGDSATDSSTDTGTDSEDDNNSFRPVMTGKVEFEPVEDDDMEEGFISRMGSLLQNSLSNGTEEKDEDTTKYQLASIDDQDLKGRYYYDKFQFTPFDADKHTALRRAYIEGLVWNLKYYYEGCVSWEWYYPYHYGPMLSDLVDLDELLEDISFEDKGKPLNPFEQLLGCMPPSQAHHLPEPYRWLMLDPQSPIIDFYPKTFTVDMNGKRWPWEAVVLLPFIDSKRLLEATSTVDLSLLSQDDRDRNSEGTTVVMMHDPSHEEVVPPIGELDCFGEMSSCSAISVPFELSDWNYASGDVAVLKPVVKDGTNHPLAGYSSLRTAPVQSLWRRKNGLNIFGGRSRYKTASLEMSSLMPPLPPVELLAPKLIGTSVYVNFPHYVEALVTAVSDKNTTVRGKSKPRPWSKEEASRWKFQRDGITRQAEIGESVPGSGGLILPPDQPITLSVRPFQGLTTTKDGVTVKTYAKFELEIPLVSTFWSPTELDQRLSGIPSRLEKNVFEIAVPTVPNERPGRKSSATKGKGSKRRRLFPAKSRSPKNSSSRKSTDINGSPKLSAAYYSTLQSQVAMARPLGSSIPSFPASSLFLRRPLGHRSFSSCQGRLHFTQVTPLPVAGRAHYEKPRNIILPSSCRGLSAPPIKSFGPKGRIVAASVVAAAFLLNVVQATQEWSSISRFARPLLLHGALTEERKGSRVHENLKQLISIRGGDFEETSLMPHGMATPALEFAHGTTTLSFTFQGGIIVAVDSRASLGSFVGSKTVEKVLPVSSHVLGTMAGGAADCQFWIRKIKSEALLHELIENGKQMSVTRVSRILSNYLYSMRGLDLSVGTMIAGWDAKGPQIFYVDNTGMRINGDLFAVGSGSTFALSILDTQTKRYDMSADEAIQLGIRAIRHATFRDAYSGGFINVFLITPKEGWKKVYTEDIARSPEVWKSLRVEESNKTRSNTNDD
ncbi:MAG: hypothetical protein SGILL_004483 [Bacillariaceae sp.]